MLKQFFGDLRIVVIESPYDTLDLPLTRELFSQCAAIKIDSYRSVYPYGVLPVDAYDFVATHHFLCRERGGSLEILMGFKTITWGRCRTHQLPFPAVSLLKASGAAAHAQVMENRLIKHETAPERVSYGGSWTATPSARENPVLKPLLRELFIGMLVLHERAIGTTERFCYGVLKVKTDKFFQNYGYAPIANGQGTLLPPFNSSALLGDPGLILQCSTFSEEAERLAEKYKTLWDSRLQIDADLVARELEKKVAA